MRVSSRSILFLFVALELFAWCGCSKTPPSKPRTRQQIMAELTGLDQMYMTEKTNQRFISTGGKGKYYDEKLGEVCWPALCCNAPDCPGRKPDGTPYIFIEPDPGVKLKPDGTMEFNVKAAKQDRIPWDGFCPLCWAAKNLKSASAAERQKYINYVRVYELPESKKRREALEAELQHWYEYVNQQANRKVTPAEK
ncbi:MAG TPA: hypothetical protein VGI75_05100 [Pirellulales bacterium]|jgi:hypothetical protein